MLTPESTGPLTLRLVLSSAALAVSVAGAVILALLGLPQILVLGLALVTAVALTDVAAIVSAGRGPRFRPSSTRDGDPNLGSPS